MSFILDALKKLEQKRQQGSVPDLMTVHEKGHKAPKKRMIWPYLLLIALLLNAGILLAWLHPWQAEEHPVIAKAASKTEQQNDTDVVNEGSNEIETVERVTTSAGFKEKQTGAETETAGNISPGRQDEIIAETEPGAEDSAPDTSSVTSDPDETKAPSGEEIAEAIEESLAPDRMALLNLDMSEQDLQTLRSKIKEEQSLTGGETPSISEPVEDVKTEAEDSVLEFSRLPSEIKKELPKIKITGHIYSNNPRARMANINGSIIRQGESVTRGLKVDEITMSGIIFNYRGTRFSMRAF